MDRYMTGDYVNMMGNLLLNIRENYSMESCQYWNPGMEIYGLVHRMEYSKRREIYGYIIQKMRV